MKRFRSALVCLALSLPLLVAAPATADAFTTSGSSSTGRFLDPRRPVYLALGDSIANGQQSAPLTVDYWTTIAGWRANGYVAQFKDQLEIQLNCWRGTGTSRTVTTTTTSGCPQLQLLNLSRSAVPEMYGLPARPGVTTQILIDEQLPIAVKLLRARNKDSNPRNNVPVVTLTVGGNDVFGPVRDACLLGDPLSPTCESAIRQGLTSFTTNYTLILQRLRSAAGKHATILTMTYYNPLPYCALGQLNPAAGPFAALFLEGGTLPNGAELEVGLNDVIRSVSAKYSAIAVDTYGDLGDGDFVGGTDCLHPNLAGHTKIAAEFSAAMH